MKKITIAIDGFSSTGKSTIAKKLAQALNYVYVDSGAMYRAVTYFAIQKGIISNGEVSIEDLIKALPEIQISFKYNEDLGFSETYLNGENVTKAIRTMDISRNVSRIAEVSEVRQKLVEQQQEMGKEKGVVMDGRDIGTVVFPDAEMKLFMTATPAIRAKRRYKELIDRGEEVQYEDVLESEQRRDLIDSTREDSPLKRAADAIEFDNTDMGIEEQFERILAFAKRIIEA
ncbi:(d)CMP kinase [Imtechella halotolerans]|uniref:Cytidylate kinase n=1 Tax=Imtechella halotolerans K1 TaxID=946077 RepID=I0W9F4_9FLAO|nr:(d)CMP kinase [Imtechella halotolerans]EID73020.1 cytidylate kinase [Imtechella halotolerans K1]WMQ62118.1 (d)CMP kinase [Imtechella halotolerans]